MRKIKFFKVPHGVFDTDRLEAKVDKWINEHNININIIDIQFRNGADKTVMIVYEYDFKEEMEEEK